MSFKHFKVSKIKLMPSYLFFIMNNQPFHAASSINVKIMLYPFMDSFKGTNISECIISNF